jgi:DNA-binding MarR family transcriptional regulator
MSNAVDSVREFNRFYTRRMGLLGPGYLRTAHTVAEARVLWELAHAGGPLEVTQLRERFGMDPGHLSRLLTRLERQGLLRREPSPSGDRRKQRVALTDEGREAFATLDRRSADAVGAQLAELSEPARERLTRALGEVRRALDPAPRAQGSTSRSRSLAVSSSWRTQKTQPAGRPSTSAIQAASRAGSCAAAKPATIRATSAS